MRFAIAALLVAATLPAADLTNPVWSPDFHVRDPAVVPVTGGYDVYFSRYRFGEWKDPANWTIGRVFTKDFSSFEDRGDVSPTGFAAPARPGTRHGRQILAYQRYPSKPVELVYATSTDGAVWSAPTTFLSDANQLAWNTRKRVIDPTLVVDGDRLVCFFVGTTDKDMQINLVGVAETRDPDLKTWTIVSRETPLIGPVPGVPDGAENIDVLRDGDHWTMIFSRGLRNQHLAYGVSKDLLTWDFRGDLPLTPQPWMARRYGAPSVWKEGDTWRMLLMGEDPKAVARVGLLSSPDGIAWTLLPAAP